MTLTEKYVQGLKQAYENNGAKEEWQHFENIKHGATKEKIEKIKEKYPLAPESLLALLEYVDGTHWREYKEESVAFFFLGSDVEEYPYYIKSAEEIINEPLYGTSDMLAEHLAWTEEIEDGWDDRLAKNTEAANWLHFSDCMNNGGTSQLFVDFTPSTSGKIGQVVRYLHDPDEIIVIADSFDDYLQMLIDEDFAFINEDTVGN
ncbi:MAG: SMI1/KNR4 family protein [Defluviitaleaceae bacterium]|nr:SMI1/KNR4 family protein [Defluviitaleaceae bacterium]